MPFKAGHSVQIYAEKKYARGSKLYLKHPIFFVVIGVGTQREGGKEREREREGDKT